MNDKQDELPTKVEIQDWFDQKIRQQGWNPSNPTMWVFFFSARDKRVLDGMCPALEAEGYEIFDIFENDLQGERESNLWMMLVQKIEVHTVDSLYARNQSLIKLAKAHRDSFFEGWNIED